MILEKWTGRGLTQESGEDKESLGNPVTIWLTKQLRIWNYVKLLKDMKPQIQQRTICLLTRKIYA